MRNLKRKRYGTQVEKMYTTEAHRYEKNTNTPSAVWFHRSIQRSLVIIVTACYALLSSGCSTIGLAGNNIQRRTYELPDISVKANKHEYRKKRHILVIRPRAFGIFNTDRIIVRKRAIEIQFLSDAQWTDQLPMLLQRSLMKTLESTKRLHALWDSRLATQTALSLATDIHKFEYQSDKKKCVIELSVRLLETTTNRIIRTASLRGEAIVMKDNPEHIVFSIGAALSKISIKLARWVLDSYDMITFDGNETIKPILN